MRAEDIKPGMWLRHAWGNLWRVADRGAPDRWTVRCVDGRKGVLCDGHAAMWDPWTPRVGEWVESERLSGPFQVTHIVDGFAFNQDPAEPRRQGRRSANVSNLKPCLPPKVEGKAGLDTPAVQEAAQAAVVVALPPKACDCPRCTGPVATLLTMPCQGADWRQAEPEVLEMWRDRDGGWHPATVLHCKGDERAWQAEGRGVTKRHPIREEAIRLWREAVR